MDQSSDLLNMKISELLKTSKQVQNKMRQELSRQAGSSFVAEKCTATWNNTVPSPYIKNVVAEYLLDNLNLNEKPVEVEVQTEIEKSPKRVGIQETEKTRSPKSIISTEKNLESLSQMSFAPTTHSSRKTVKSKILPMKSGRINQLEYPKSSIKSSVSTTAVHRFPLQRFAGTSTKGSIDFSKEHPDLQLDSNQTTLFPRRFRRETDTSSIEKESINLVTAEIKPPVVSATKDPETWNEVLSNNRTTRKQQVLRLKVNVADLQSAKAIPAPKLREQKVVDIISTPGNGLFQIEKESERLLKQSKCNLQSFPVMYIRPEYQVQRVANISICGDNRIHNPGDNVKYVECMHEEKKQEEKDVSPSIERIHSPYKEPEIHTPLAEVVTATPREENKYFKALRMSVFSEHSSNSSEISSSTFALSSRRQSRVSSSSSASKAQQSSSPTSDNDVDCLIENILASSNRPQPATEKSIKKYPTRREVYVQTDHTSTDATIAPSSPPPLREVYVQTDYTNHKPPPTDNKATSPLPSPLITITDKPNHLQKAVTTNDNFIEDDFISKMFDRIRNDVPNALQAFKSRNATLPEAESHSLPQQHQEPAESHQNQVSRINDTSNAEFESRLSPVQCCSHTRSEMPPTARSTLNVQSPAGGDEGRKFMLLQQNPLFVQTINKIKSSAAHSAMPADDKIKDGRHKYPTDAEIKRAVKIFLDSLALEGKSDGNTRKSIIKGGGIRRSELLSSTRVHEYISSVSSHTSNSASSSSSSGFRSVKNRNKFLPNRGGSRSSTSTTVSSLNQKTESDETVSPTVSPQSSKRTDHSLSDGEVLSIGEV